MKIKRFKLRDNVTKEDLIALGFEHGGTWVKKDAKLYLCKVFGWHSINIAFSENINDWNDYDNVLVLDEEAGQPHFTFYDERYYGKDVTRFAALEKVIQNYNEFMSSLRILEEINEV